MKDVLVRPKLKRKRPFVLNALLSSARYTRVDGFPAPDLFYSRFGTAATASRSKRRNRKNYFGFHVPLPLVYETLIDSSVRKTRYFRAISLTVSLFKPGAKINNAPAASIKAAHSTKQRQLDLADISDFGNKLLSLLN